MSFFFHTLINTTLHSGISHHLLHNTTKDSKQCCSPCPESSQKLITHTHTHIYIYIYILSPHISSLHWLPSDLRAHCSLFSLLQLPQLNRAYNQAALKIHKPTHQLCSSPGTSMLCLPSVRMLPPGQRSFCASPSFENTSLNKVREHP